MSIKYNGTELKKVIYNGTELKEVIYNGTRVYTSIPDILYIYNKKANSEYPLVYTGGTQSPESSINAARDEGTQVYLAASTSGLYHSAGYMCYTQSKIDVTEYNKLVRTPTQNYCGFGLASTIPGWGDLWNPSKFVVSGGYQQTEINISSIKGSYYIICWAYVSSGDGSYVASETRFNQLYLSK